MFKTLSEIFLTKRKISNFYEVSNANAHCAQVNVELQFLIIRFLEDEKNAKTSQSNANAID